MLLHYLGKLKIQIFCRNLADFFETQCSSNTSWPDYNSFTWTQKSSKLASSYTGRTSFARQLEMKCMLVDFNLQACAVYRYRTTEANIVKPYHTESSLVPRSKAYNPSADQSTDQAL